MQLRAYQVAAIEALREKIRAGQRRLLLCMPCGGGKTIVAAEIIRSAVSRGKRCLFIAHRKELIDQSVDKLARFGVETSVMMADARWPTSVCTIQTLARRMDRLPPADLVVYDEVHHSASETGRKVLSAYADAVVLGLTATPWRSDRFGLADYFQGHVVGSTPRELQAMGSLVECDVYAYDSPELDEVPLVAGEYNQKALDVACNTRVLVGNAVKEYLAHAAGRKAICFPVSIAHSKALVAEFIAAGVAAEHVDFKTPRLEREAALARFKTGETMLVSSVGILSEGFDEPSAEVAILMRPTKSLVLHMQQIGRVLRPSPGKQRALIHCHSGNMLRHGFYEDDRDYTPGKTPARVVAMHTCPLCNAVFASLRAGKCPRCGELIAPPPEPQLTKKARKAATSVAGLRVDVTEIRRRRAAAGIGRQVSDLEAQRIATASEWAKKSEFQRLRLLCHQRGYRLTWAFKCWRDTFGEFPHYTEAELAGVTPARWPFLKTRRSA